MGVVHKLHPDVVAFILAHKRSNPALGCRQLSELALREMGVSISKSTISNLLKSENLNSAIGRPPVSLEKDERSAKKIKDAKEHFKIPSDKKKKIMADLKQVQVVSDSPIEKKEKNFTPQPQTTAIFKVVTSPADLSNVSQPVADGSSFQKTDFAVPAWSRGAETHPYMGLIFLKAAEWAMMNASIWGKVFQGTREGKDAENFEAICEADMFINGLFLKKDSLSGNGQRGARIINGLSPDEELSVNPVLMQQKASCAQGAYETEIHLAESRATSVAMILFSGERLLFDPQMVFLGGDTKNAGFFSLPFFHTTRLWSERLISNIKSFNIFCLSDQDGLKVFLKMHRACSSGDLKAVTIENGREAIWEWNEISSFERKYLVGLWPWTRNFNVFTQKIGKWTSQGFSFSLQKEHTNVGTCSYLYQGDMLLEDRELQIIDAGGRKADVRLIVGHIKERPVLAVLSNDVISSAETLIHEFFGRWPQGDAVFYGVARHLKTNGYELKEDLSDRIPWEIDAGDFHRSLQMDFCRRLMRTAAQICFRPSDKTLSKVEYLENFIKISGSLLIHGQTIQVVLRPDDGYALQEPLQMAIRNINDLDVLDWSGRVLRIFCG